jgi:hypothetical protein
VFARIGRGVGLALAGIALVAGVTACGKAITGAAQPAPDTKPTGAGRPSGDSGASQQAQQTCAQLPKDAVTSAFGVSDVTVTTDNGSTKSGILQIKCAISAKGGAFRANVVVQIYPAGTLTSPAQYLGIMQQKFHAQSITVPGADEAGTFQQTLQGALVDEAFAAKKDATSDTIDVVLAATGDSADVKPKLVAFITALAND